VIVAGELALAAAPLRLTGPGILEEQRMIAPQISAVAAHYALTERLQRFPARLDFLLYLRRMPVAVTAHDSRGGVLMYVAVKGGEKAIAGRPSVCKNSCVADDTQFDELSATADRAAAGL
jgi:hypothetical protein